MQLLLLVQGSYLPIRVTFECEFGCNAAFRLVAPNALAIAYIPLKTWDKSFGSVMT